MLNILDKSELWLITGGTNHCWCQETWGHRDTHHRAVPIGFTADAGECSRLCPTKDYPDEGKAGINGWHRFRLLSFGICKPTKEMCGYGFVNPEICTGPSC